MVNRIQSDSDKALADVALNNTVNRILDKITVLQNEYLKWWEVLIAVGLGAAAYYLPYWMLQFQRRLRALEMQNEVDQFHVLISVLCEFERISVETVLEWLERYSIIFRPALQKCLLNYDSGAEMALRTLSEDAPFEAFQRIVKRLLQAVEKLTLKEAFDDLEMEQEYYAEQKKERLERLIRKKTAYGKMFGWSPGALLISLYLDAAKQGQTKMASITTQLSDTEFNTYNNTTLSGSQVLNAVRQYMNLDTFGVQVITGKQYAPDWRENVSETAENILFFTIEIFLLITACIFTIGGIRTQEAAGLAVQQADIREERRLFSSLEVNGQETYSGAQVLQSIRQIGSLEVNIRVNGRVFYQDDEVSDLDLSAVFIAVVLMFGYPLYQQARNQDDLSQLVVQSAVTSFVDAARTKGYITPNMYLEFNLKLGATGNRYDVQMEHLHKKYNPVYSNPADPNTFKDSFDTYYDGHYMPEIMTVLFPNTTLGADDISRRYVMAEGDFFTVKVKNVNRTMATVLGDFFTGGNTSSNVKVFVPYGGMVINEDY
ncbi:hypothetical protein KC345_g10744 [Hortaea werneckii]|nr:hypothetical protein KC345_g10744 [Hortaea werneckii]